MTPPKARPTRTRWHRKQSRYQALQQRRPRQHLCLTTATRTLRAGRRPGRLGRKLGAALIYAPLA
eukprot:8078608-Pyramimonas_sp.AAC.1